MTAIVKRITKGSTLTVAELDANVANLNTAKLETTGGTLTGLPVLANQDVDIISPVYPTTKPSLNLDFTRGQLDPRITFARNSGAAYYDGKTTAKAEENLLRYSGQISHPYWSLSNPTPATANSIIAPDGTMTASTITGTLSGYTHFIYSLSSTLVPSTIPYTYSVYLQAGTINSVRILFYNNNGGNNSYATFNLLDSTYVLGGNASTATVTQVGSSSWYRCSVTGTCSGAGYATAVLYADNGYYYVWGAQLEQRSSVTAYTPTTTAPITNYIPVMKFAPANAPRFDYDPITGKPLGLLIEEGRTNLLIYSGDLTLSSGGGVTRINNLIAPDGTLTGTLSTATGTGANFFISQSSAIAVTAGITYTASIYIKGIGSSIGKTPAFWFWYAGTATGAAVFSSGVLTADWKRFTISTTPTGSGTLYIRLDQTGINTSVAGESVGVWGSQAEAGSFATSYIPTTTGSVSRQPDQASMTGSNFSSWYNQSQGSLYVETIAVFGTNNSGTAGLSDGTVNNSINMYGNQTSSYLDSIVSGVTVVGNYSYGLTNYPLKSIYSYLTNNTITTANGITPLVDSSCAIPTVNRLIIGSIYSGNSFFLNGHIRKLTYYPKALSSTELQALTS